MKRFETDTDPILQVTWLNSDENEGIEKLHKGVNIGRRGTAATLESTTITHTS